MEKSVYLLDLHEVVVVEDDIFFTTAIRVPSGWMYRSYDRSHGIMAAVFVPFDNQFWNTAPSTGGDKQGDEG